MSWGTDQVAAEGISHRLNPTIRPASGQSCVFMNFKREYTLPEHLQNAEGLPRNRQERLLWIRRKVEEGYYDSETVIRAVADAFLEPQEVRRAGDRTWRQVGEAD